MMTSSPVGTHRHRALAAARLAVVYTIGVLLLLIPFMFLPYGGLPSFADAAEVGGLAAIPFALAFLSLTVARRAGFVALWTLLGALWGLLLAAHDPSIDLLIAFVGWSVLALPLHVLTAIGIPSVLYLRIARARLSMAALATILWTLALVPAVAVLYSSQRIMHPEPDPVFLFASDIAAFIWGPAPVVLVALSIAHAWTGTQVTRPSGRWRNVVITPRSRAILAISVLAALAAGLDVIAHFTGPTRPLVQSSAGVVVVRPTGSGYGIRILRPDMSTVNPMPCFQSPNADSTHHAGRPGLGHSPCEVASADTSAPNQRPKRSLGVW